MKQVIPFYKEIVFSTNVASIVSMSLEHEEKVLDGEVSGNFIIFGEYKVHNDTTEKESFKYKLPFTTLISDEMNKDTIVVDVENFSYEQIEDDVIRIDIDFSLEYELLNEDVCDNNDNEDEMIKIEREIDEIIGKKEEDNLLFEEAAEDEDRDDSVLVPLLYDNQEKLEINDDLNNTIDNEIEDDTMENVVVKEEISTKIEDNEYVTYHVHIVKENDSLEHIIKNYNISIDYLKEYNEIKELKVGDKIIIPEYDE